MNQYQPPNDPNGRPQPPSSPFVKETSSSGRPIKYIGTVTRGQLALFKRLNLTVGLLMMAYIFLTVKFTSFSLGTLLDYNFILPFAFAGIFLFFTTQFFGNKLRFRFRIVDHKPTRLLDTVKMMYGVNDTNAEAPPRIPTPPEPPIETNSTPVEPIVNNIQYNPHTQPQPPLQQGSMDNEATPNINKYGMSIIIALFGLVTFGMILIWALDTSISAILVGGQLSGFYNASPSLIYHTALMGIIVLFIVFSYIALYTLRIKGIPITQPKLQPLIPSAVISSKASFGFVAPHLALIGTGFTVVLLYLAGFNEARQVMVTFNAFGEWMIEVALFTVIFIILVVYCLSINKLYKKRKRI